MIKFAVTPPKQRIQAIQTGVDMLNWPEDDYLKHFGVQVEPNMTVTTGRLLPNPEVQFGAHAKVNPGISGRWDLRGKKFLRNNPQPLKSWGIAVVDRCVDEPTVRNFLKTFIISYMGHGGNVTNKNPVIYVIPSNEDVAQGTLMLRELTMKTCKPFLVRLKGKNANKISVNAVPQILMYVLGSRNSWTYERLKKNNECRYGLVSQSEYFISVHTGVLLRFDSGQCCTCAEGIATILQQFVHEVQREAGRHYISYRRQDSYGQCFLLQSSYDCHWC
jgi:eukaryotic translation initiation factor 2C